MEIRKYCYKISTRILSPYSRNYRSLVVPSGARFHVSGAFGSQAAKFLTESICACGLGLVMGSKLQEVHAQKPAIRTETSLQGNPALGKSEWGEAAPLVDLLFIIPAHAQYFQKTCTYVPSALVMRS